MTKDRFGPLRGRNRRYALRCLQRIMNGHKNKGLPENAVTVIRAEIKRLKFEPNYHPAGNDRLAIERWIVNYLPADQRRQMEVEKIEDNFQ